ncbi:LysE/ArgO family amino acid transporter [Xinfangfangia sp. CPCC 101601]|uniref:LysE/ArgO family amino acid transporter n=1 Tax=Pseudogemmobacter lacusdianii TaxID=3069608 RepID=A0ABU0W1G4_9RHOB|nr:LysE/ArgO family amino acid transporter [Xinfangfangia sp. CPCC 101601]MDQ2067270.1 LysE/ArgO family amino acid transporter [Xinfangfangia sp. CPCC 101601]
MTEAVFAGFFTGLSLILAIGAQNAFVLRQGLRREHVGLVVAICAGSDALLIAAGVSGFGALSAMAPWLAETMRWGGVAFLVVYGALRFAAAARGGAALLPSAAPAAARGQVVATALLLTWANPHVYLDTVVLLGSVAAQYPGRAMGFAAGAMTASVCFFTALGYGARLLAPIFAQAKAWVWLEIGVGLLMWSIAAALVFS